MNHDDATNSGGRTPESQTPDDPATPSLTLFLCTGHHQLTDLHTRDVDHLVEERLGYLYGPPNKLHHVKRPLRHERDVDDVTSPRFSPRAATVGAQLSPHKRQLWNSNDRQNKDIDHRVYGNKGISMVCQTMGIKLRATTGV